MTKSEFTNDLAKLVSFATLSGSFDELKKALDFIESKIDTRAVIERINNQGVETLVASNIRTKTPDICYLVHADVVAGKPSQFTMKIEGDLAIGRGTDDMKYSIPLGYNLLNEIIASGKGPSFALVVTTDEEVGGFKGAKYMADVYQMKPKVFLVPDGGNDFTFESKSKGVCGIRVDAKGKPAHASMLWKGKSALEPLVKLSTELLKRYEKNNRKESWKTTMNIGKFQGGTSTNQVCPEAYATFDFRFPETSSIQEIFDKVAALAKKIDPSLTVSIYSSGEPTAVDMKNLLVKKFIKSMEKSIGRKIKIEGSYGASDARHFAKSGAPILMTKPNGRDLHGDNESIDISSCMAFYSALQAFIKEF